MSKKTPENNAPMQKTENQSEDTTKNHSEELFSEFNTTQMVFDSDPFAKEKIEKNVKKDK